MIEPQIFMGLAIATLCVVAIANERWLLTRTRKGQRIVERFGDRRARWVVRAVFGVGALFGGALARGLINPVHWN
ncbi:MAG: hypothetical protein O2820_25375 [Planctomycetota bacterium]|nr:hypothetical protein [Planctomycetota bacterium]MDA1252547.1 hypothetical protein [Planctomycetota bacterium]